MSRPRRIPARGDVNEAPSRDGPLEKLLGPSLCPQGLRPEIARIIEELARAAVRREDRHAREYRDRSGVGQVGADQR